MDIKGCKMARHGLKWLQMAQNGWIAGKRLEIYTHICKWLYILNGKYALKQLETAMNGFEREMKQLEMAELG